MPSNWTVNWDPRAIKDLKSLSYKAKSRIFKFFEDKIHLSDNPRILGEPLSGNKSGLWRYCIGDYRAICLLKNDVLEVLIIRVGHRKEVYN
jgi:mRNA interferase RelE/StbE